MYGSGSNTTNIFGRNQTNPSLTNTNSNSSSMNRFNNDTTSHNLILGTYRTEYANYKPSDLLLSVAKNWKQFPPISILARQKTLHLTGTQLRYQDYYQIRANKLNSNHQEYLTKAFKNGCFSEQILKGRENMKLLPFSNDKAIDLQAVHRQSNNGYNSINNSGSGVGSNNYLSNSRYNSTGQASNNNNVFLGNGQSSNSNNIFGNNKSNIGSSGLSGGNNNISPNINSNNNFLNRNSNNGGNIFGNGNNSTPSSNNNINNNSNTNNLSNNLLNSQAKNNIFSQGNGNNNSKAYSNTNNNNDNSLRSSNIFSNGNGSSVNNGNNNTNYNNSNNGNHLFGNNTNNNLNNNIQNNNIFGTQNNNNNHPFSSNSNEQTCQNQLFIPQNNSIFLPNPNSNSLNSDYSQFFQSQMAMFNYWMNQQTQKNQKSPFEQTLFSNQYSNIQQNSFYPFDRQPPFKRRKHSQETTKIYLLPQKHQEISDSKKLKYTKMINNQNNFLPLESRVKNISNNSSNIIRNQKPLSIPYTKVSQSIFLRQSLYFCQVKLAIKWLDCFQLQIPQKQLIGENIELPSLDIYSQKGRQNLILAIKTRFPIIRSDAILTLKNQQKINSGHQIFLIGTIEQKMINLNPILYQVFYSLISNGKIHNLAISKKVHGVKTATVSWDQPIQYQTLDFAAGNAFNLDLSEVACDLPQLNSRCRITFRELPGKIKKIYEEYGREQAREKLIQFLEQKNEVQRIFSLRSIHEDGSWTFQIEKFD